MTGIWQVTVMPEARRFLYAPNTIDRLLEATRAVCVFAETVVKTKMPGL